MPISNDSSVPDTAPAANSTPIALAQVCARSRSTGLPRVCARHSANTTIAGNAIPKHEKTMCQPSESAICIRAGYRFSAASASTSVIGAIPRGPSRRRTWTRPSMDVPGVGTPHPPTGRKAGADRRRAGAVRGAPEGGGHGVIAPAIDILSRVA